MSNNVKKLLSMLLAIAMLASLLTACGNGSSDKSEGQPAQSAAPEGNEGAPSGESPAVELGDVVLTSEDEDAESGGVIPGTQVVARISTLPALLTTLNCTSFAETTMNIFEGLTDAYHGDYNDIRPALAEDWEVSEDGLTYTFYLRQGVTFHNGNDFKANDVVASIDILSQYNPSYTQKFESIETPDDYTVIFHLNSPYPSFLRTLATQWYCMYDAETVEEYGYDSNEAAIGTGPYYIENYQSGESVTLKANENYWNTKNIPSIERIVYKVIPDDNTAFIAFQNGEIDVMRKVTSLQLTTAQALPNVSVVSYTSCDNWVMGINSTVEPFDKLEVRQALAYMIDKAQINQAAYDGIARPTNSTYIAISPTYCESDYNYDVDKGLELLSSVGMEPSDISFTIRASSGAQTKAIAENIQAQLLALGMDVQVETMDEGTLQETRVSGDFVVNIYDTGATLYNPMDNLFIMCHSGGVVNTSFFKVTMPEVQAQVDELIDLGLAAPTMEESCEYGVQAVDLMQDNVGWIPLIEKDDHHLINSRVSGLVVDTTAGQIEYYKATVSN